MKKLQTGNTKHTNNRLLFVMMILIPLFSINCLFAQERDSTDIYLIATKDGNEYIGNILYEDSEKIVLKTETIGQITILKAHISKITIVNSSSIKEGEYWLDNLQSTRYFWAPNGYGLKKGEGYYQNVWIMFNQFSVGVSDNFSIGAGVIPVFLFGVGVAPVWVTPKFSIPIEENKFNLGAGGLFGAVIGEDVGFGIVYGNATFGSRDRNGTIGVGYGYANGDWANSPTITFSFLARTSQRGYFISENYFIGANNNFLLLFSFGGRRLIKNVGLDYGLIVPFTRDMDTFIAIPWLGLTIPFENKK